MGKDCGVKMSGSRKGRDSRCVEVSEGGEGQAGAESQLQRV